MILELNWNLFLHLLTFFFGTSTAFFLPAITFYATSHTKEFNLYEEVISSLSHKKDTKKIFNITTWSNAGLLILFFITLILSTNIKINSLETILIFSGLFFLSTIPLFPYTPKKNNPNRILHNITTILFILLFYSGVVILQMKMFYQNSLMIGFSLSLTFAGTIIGALLFIKSKKPTAIIEFILIFIISWWLLFFSIAQFFL